MSDELKGMCDGRLLGLYAVDAVRYDHDDGANEWEEKHEIELLRRLERGRKAEEELAKIRTLLEIKIEPHYAHCMCVGRIESILGGAMSESYGPEEAQRSLDRLMRNRLEDEDDRIAFKDDHAAVVAYIVELEDRCCVRATDIDAPEVRCPHHD